MPDEPTYRRRSARVLLIDGRDRLLLLRKLPHELLPEEGITWWTPGGGIETGETPRQAAARELHEEVGLKVDEHELGTVVATRSGYAELRRVPGGLLPDDLPYGLVPLLAELVAGRVPAEPVVLPWEPAD